MTHPASPRRTPLRSIREYCVECCGDCQGGVNGPGGCNSPTCPLYPFRFGRRPHGARPIKGIRAMCRKCLGGSPSEVRRCTDLNCPLFRFRFGKNPRQQDAGRRSAQNSRRKPPFQGVKPPEAEETTQQPPDSKEPRPGSNVSSLFGETGQTFGQPLQRRAQITGSSSGGAT